MSWVIFLELIVNWFQKDKIENLLLEKQYNRPVDKLWKSMGKMWIKPLAINY